MGNQTQGNVKERIRIKLPQMYDVVFHNDDFTTMEFVVAVLEAVFDLAGPLAEVVMMEVHTKGSAVVGTYVYDVAMTKASKTMRLAQAEGFPLRVTIQPH